MYIFLLGISVLLRHFEICKDDFLLTLATVKYSMGTNLPMRALMILKEFYDNQSPQHDQIELPKALESMANVKRKSSLQISKCLNNTEIRCLSSLLKTIHFFHFSSHITNYEVKFSNFFLYVFLSPCYLKENKQEEISKLETKLELALSRTNDMD
jgi:hypothetical protein